MTDPNRMPPPAQQVQNPYFEDPTALTSKAVEAATQQWRRDLSAARQIIETRIDAMEEATAIHRGVGGEITGRLERQLAHQKELLESLLTDYIALSSSERGVLLEKFTSIDKQFAERDVRTEQDKKSSKEALDAALLAQKESVRQQNDANTTAATKSEASFTKQTDQLVILISTLEKSLTDRITELKERIDRGEGSSAGATGAHTETRLNSTLAISIFAILLSLALIGVSIAAVVKR